ncbi:MAG TPA: hypothetical protein PK054_02810 [Anaerohalosphaeraceae bacterium]|nr:hypothetical protein [Anaerohalosphaeraceae bacterium]HOL87993.1 hypothetical protein [Anaerohalosphaeraceae bacterium]HPP55492.1 hypothetical protein [Anaerohalosphaeraceae bacterium]
MIFGKGAGTFLRWLAAVGLGSAVQAGEIVPGLDDSTALVTYTAARAGAAGDHAKITTGQITLAARFNPDESMMTGGPTIVIEDGGTTNGTGLYLGDGNLIFAAKSNNQLGLPTGMNDTDFSDNALAITLGPVNFGAENVVYASFNAAAGRLVSSINGTVRVYTITGSDASKNLDGNTSVSFLGSGTINAGHMGGLVETGAAQFPLLFWTNARNMVQTAGYTNQQGQIFAAAVPDEIFPYTVLVSQTDGATAVQEGAASDTMSIRLTSDPGAYPVTIEIADSSTPAQVLAVPSQIVFDAGSWQSFQTIVVTAADDEVKEPRVHTTLLMFQVQTDPASPYFGRHPDPLTVTIRENDCGLWGYDAVDINQDCQVDLADLSVLVQQWLGCSFPEGDCTDYRP